MLHGTLLGFMEDPNQGLLLMPPPTLTNSPPKHSVKTLQRKVIFFVLTAVAAVSVGLFVAFLYIYFGPESLALKKASPSSSSLSAGSIVVVDSSSQARPDLIDDAVQIASTLPRADMLAWLPRIIVGLLVVTAIVVTAALVYKFMVLNHPHLLDVNKSISVSRAGEFAFSKHHQPTTVEDDDSYQPDKHKDSSLLQIGLASTFGFVILVALVGGFLAYKFEWCHSQKGSGSDNGQTPQSSTNPDNDLSNAQARIAVHTPNATIPTGNSTEPISTLPPQQTNQPEPQEDPVDKSNVSEKDDDLINMLAIRFIQQLQTATLPNDEDNVQMTLLDIGGQKEHVIRLPNDQEKQTIVTASAVITKGFEFPRIVVIKDLASNEFVSEPPEHDNFEYVVIGFDSVFMRNSVFDGIRFDWLVRVVGGKEFIDTRKLRPRVQE